MTKLLLTLRFYALGTMLISVGDFAGVSKTTACLIVRLVSEAIASMGRAIIKMPTTPADIHNVQLGFYQKARCPRVIGALDCTHIRIQSPGNIIISYPSEKSLPPDVR